MNVRSHFKWIKTKALKNLRVGLNLKWEKECEKMWEATIKGTYSNIAANIKAIEKKPRFHNHDEEVDYWFEFLNEHEFLESFTDSISDAEFE